MGLKKRAKVSAEFSMSSLTDIIFLLLIFFMLTSNFVQIKATDLPESDSKTVAASSIVVEIDEKGKFIYNGVRMNSKALNTALRRAVAKKNDRNNVTITIAAGNSISWEYVTQVIQIAGRLKVKAVIATQPKK
jgi:biopolymer transport protein ExbD